MAAVSGSSCRVMGVRLVCGGGCFDEITRSVYSQQFCVLLVVAIAVKFGGEGAVFGGGMAEPVCDTHLPKENQRHLPPLPFPFGRTNTTTMLCRHHHNDNDNDNNNNNNNNGTVNNNNSAGGGERAGS